MRVLIYTKVVLVKDFEIPEEENKEDFIESCREAMQKDFENKGWDLQKTDWDITGDVNLHGISVMGYDNQWHDIED